MKTWLIFVFGFLAAFLLTPRDSSPAYKDAYAYGYADGIYEGYLQGTGEAAEKIEDLLRDELMYLAFDVEDKYGISPEDAMQIITNYADGEPISEADLHNAIWAMNMYYRDVSDAIGDISEYCID